MMTLKLKLVENGLKTFQERKRRKYTIEDIAREVDMFLKETKQNMPDWMRKELIDIVYHQHKNDV